MSGIARTCRIALLAATLSGLPGTGLAATESGTDSASARTARTVGGPSPALPSSPVRSVSPEAWTLSAAGDDRGVRLGFDGTLRLSAMRREREASAWSAAEPSPAPAGAGLQFGAIQSLGTGDPANASFASLRMRFDGPRAYSWLGLGSRVGTASAPVSTRLHLGAGWEPRLRSMIQVEAAAFVSPVSIPGGTVRRVIDLHIPRQALGHTGEDSTYLADPEPAPSHDALWTSGQTTLCWRHGRAEIATVAGITVGPFTRPQRWAQAQVRYRLSPGWTMSLAAGRAAPAALVFDPRSASRTQLGIEFSPLSRFGSGDSPAFRPMARRWSAVSLRDGRVALHLECHHARRLEVRADFTEWEPVEMRSIGSSWWELVVAAEPGLYFVQIRIDGGPWEAPPDLPLSATGDQGAAGTMLIR